MNFLVLSGKMLFPRSENMILFFRQKMKDHLSQKNTWNYEIFCISVKMEVVPLFPTNFALPFCKKRKDDLLAKIITEKDDVHPRNI